MGEVRLFRVWGRGGSLSYLPNRKREKGSQPQPGSGRHWPVKKQPFSPVDSLELPHCFTPLRSGLAAHLLKGLSASQNLGHTAWLCAQLREGNPHPTPSRALAHFTVRPGKATFCPPDRKLEGLSRIGVEGGGRRTEAFRCLRAARLGPLSQFLPRISSLRHGGGSFG